MPPSYILPFILTITLLSILYLCGIVVKLVVVHSDANVLEWMGIGWMRQLLFAIIHDDYYWYAPPMTFLIFILLSYLNWIGRRIYQLN